MIGTYKGSVPRLVAQRHLDARPGSAARAPFVPTSIWGAMTLVGRAMSDDGYFLVQCQKAHGHSRELLAEGRRGEVVLTSGGGAVNAQDNAWASASCKSVGCIPTQVLILHLPLTGESVVTGPARAVTMTSHEVAVLRAPSRSLCRWGFHAQVHQAGDVGDSCRSVAFERVPRDNPDGRAFVLMRP